MPSMPWYSVCCVPIHPNTRSISTRNSAAPIPASTLISAYRAASAALGSERSNAHTRWSAAASVMIDASATSHDGPSGTRLNQTAITVLATAMASSGPVHAGTAAAAPPPSGTDTAGPRQHAISHTV